MTSPSTELVATDKGQIRLEIASIQRPNKPDNEVRLDFAVPVKVAWLTPEQARWIAQMLVEQADGE